MTEYHLMSAKQGRIIGYARVSTQDQQLDIQIDALEKAGCERILRDPRISAVSKHRPGFEEALQEPRTVDV